jgi:hypothetical protein
MDKENVAYTHNRVIKNNEIMLFTRKMNGNGKHHVKRDEQNSERQISHVVTHFQTLDLKPPPPT